MMRRSLDELPVEILEIILSYVPCSDLWRSLPVSRLWHEVAESMCYPQVNICLSGERAKNVRYSLDERQLDWIRQVTQLTVKVPLVPAADYDLDADLKMILIDQILPRAKELESFTLITIDNCEGEQTCKGVSKVILGKILNQLRGIPTLSSLILDIDAPYQEYQFLSDEDPLHPCSAISALMLQLEHVKMRLPCVCPHLIADYRVAVEKCPPARPMKSFVVNGVYATPGKALAERRVSQHCEQGPFDRWGAVRETFPTWMGFARRVSQSMPELERFWVITETRQDGHFVAADRIKQEGFALPADDWTANQWVSLPPSAIRPWF